MLRLERLKQAQGELFFGGILGIECRFGGPLLFGDTLLLEGLFLLIPRTELRGRLIEDKAHGERDFGGYQDEKNEALSPQIAPTGFIAQVIKIGQGLGRFGARVVRIVDNQGARGDAMVLQDDPHTGHEQVVPGYLAMAKHPRQGGQRIGAEAGAFKARPANGVGDQYGGDTKRQPGPLRSGQRVTGMMRAHDVSNGVNKGAYKRRRLAKNHWRLQTISAPQAERTFVVILA